VENHTFERIKCSLPRLFLRVKFIASSSGTITIKTTT
jgi:hypothetical protein